MAHIANITNTTLTFYTYIVQVLYITIGKGCKNTYVTIMFYSTSR